MRLRSQPRSPSVRKARRARRKESQTFRFISAMRSCAARRRCRQRAMQCRRRRVRMRARCSRLVLRAGDKARVQQGDASALLEVALDESHCRRRRACIRCSRIDRNAWPDVWADHAGARVMDAITAFGSQTLGSAWPVVWSLTKITAIVLPILGLVAYLTLWERRLIGWFHIRMGPNRVGPLGLFQPIADGIQAAHQRNHFAVAGGQIAVLPGADRDPDACAGGMGGDSVRPRHRAGRHQRRPAVRDGDHVGRRLRRHHRGLGVQLEVCVSRCDARSGTDGQLRNRHGLRAGDGADGCRHVEPDADRGRPEHRHVRRRWD